MVALVVPYRNRPSQLPIFISRIFPFLQRQLVDFRMFLIEQDPSGAFNRAKLFNVGYNESSKYGDFDCFIFHDVDLIPENDTNLYQCEDQPKHMSPAMSSFNYRIPYSSFVGGVLAMNKTVFQLVNGFSNLYLGWGGEDDDMSVRILENGFKVRRPPLGADSSFWRRRRREWQLKG
ncbi:beta-1,4-galactosyltransferase 4-like [Dreissena polymorpha]|uniref:beta-1,4-galactosyltransferase 4-like n=1 Tax=Dreissena polymorpha TaxID=45954 RepID=UPI002264AF89|nr:beta-1,4-galactosyltransferase 4-like [Dreissena polymorpha]